MHESGKAFRFQVAVLINVVLFAIEGGFGLFSRSSALIADSFHVAAHAAALIAASVAILREDKATDAFISKLVALLIVALAVLAASEAAMKIFSPTEILSGTMLATSVFGLLVNAFVAFYLWSHRHSGESVKAYWVCLKGDIASSFAAIAAAGLIFFGGSFFRPADPIAALFIAFWLLWRSGSILAGREAHGH